MSSTLFIQNDGWQFSNQNHPTPNKFLLWLALIADHVKIMEVFLTVHSVSLIIKVTCLIH